MIAENFSEMCGSCCFPLSSFSTCMIWACMRPNGENYIVLNYKANSVVRSIWVLWNAEDRFFSPRLKNSNARSLNGDAAADKSK
jgi:hypothetical protein